MSAELSSTGSHIAIIPANILPGYSASKSALNCFAMCLRDQLHNSDIKVVDISPPAVASKLICVDVLG
jgi:short-subunit dehydrogenase involved in D-alanine esterification of teichoic acids